MQRSCDRCGNHYEAKRETSKFCSAKCRVANHQSPRPKPKPAASAPVVTVTSGQLEAATRARLGEVNRLATVLGQQALAIAHRIDSPFETGSAVAALSKEFRAVMVEALEGLNVVADPLDELRVRRDSRRSAAG